MLFMHIPEAPCHIKDKLLLLVAPTVVNKVFLFVTIAK